MSSEKHENYATNVKTRIYSRVIRIQQLQANLLRLVSIPHSRTLAL